MLLWRRVIHCLVSPYDNSAQAKQLPRAMYRPWLHRYSIILAVCALVSATTGALIPAPASPGAIADAVWLERLHEVAAAPVALLSAGLAIWLSVVERRGWLHGLGWVVLATVILGGWLARGVAASGAPVLSVVHACLAQLFFAATVAMGVFTSHDWQREPDALRDQGRPSLRSLSIATPAVVITQVVLEPRTVTG